VNTALVTLLMVDDEPAVGAAMARRLRDVEGIAWLGCAASFEAGLKMNRQLRPRVILLDLDMVLDTLATSIAALERENADGSVVMFTGYATPQLIESSLVAGAGGFITKETDPSRMLQLIRAAAAGDVVLCPSSVEITRPRHPERPA
jgi:two-component system, NarL family, invasion response regulator UvrY